jgi:O-antigen/teichoic acid export membrane protein
MGPNGTLLMSTGNVRFLFAVTVFAAITNILLNFKLIPEYGILGAAVSTLISYLSLNLLLLVFIWRAIGITHLSKQYFSLIITAAVLALGYVGVTNCFAFVLEPKPLVFGILLVIFFVVAYVTEALDLDLVRDELLNEESDRMTE